jgi:hypothetical protein
MIKLHPLLAIARVTFEEVVRQPMYGAIVLLTLIAFALSPALAMFSFEDDVKLLKDFGSSTILLAGLFLAAFGASAGVASDLESGTASTIFSKPVGRGTFLAGRFVGLALALALAVLLFSIALLLAEREGPPTKAGGRGADGPVIAGSLGGALLALLYGAWRSLRSGIPLGGAAAKAGAITLPAGFLLPALLDPAWRPQRPFAGFDLALAEACLLAFEGVVLLGAIAALLAAVLRRGVLPGLLVIFFAGLLLEDAAGGWCPLPAFGVFSVGEVFYEPARSIPLLYIAQAGTYAAAYGGACLFLGAWLLERREAG